MGGKLQISLQFNANFIQFLKIGIELAQHMTRGQLIHRKHKYTPKHGGAFVWKEIIPEFFQDSL